MQGGGLVAEHDDERAPVIWDQPEVRARPSVPLDRARIVAAAIALADAEGLDALTMRKLATALDVSPMSLYRHVARKEDLIDLMLDHVVGEYGLIGVPSGNWRADLTTLARQQRAAALRHPWSIVPVARPSLGPNAIAHLETALSAFEVAGLPIARKAWAANLVETYVRGSVEAELADTAAEHRTGITTEQWQQTMQPYLTRLLDTGRYPHVKEFLEDSDDITRDEAFELGLSTLLNGLESRISGETG
jgi:AcrR family transcriptional regulator